MPRIPILVAALLLLCSTMHINAQVHDSVDHAGRFEFAITDGVLSHDQWRGISHREARAYSDLVDMPHTLSGAAFVTAHYYLANRLAVGVSLGLDNQRGRLSYGGPHSGNSGIYGDAGYYRRECYTAAVEAAYTYERWPDGAVYCLVGAGASFTHCEYGIYPTAQLNFYNRYKPVSRSVTYLVPQVTPIAFRAGRRLAVIAEIGYGYKGLVCLGASYRV